RTPVSRTAIPSTIRVGRIRAAARSFITYKCPTGGHKCQDENVAQRVVYIAARVVDFVTYSANDATSRRLEIRPSIRIRAWASSPRCTTGCNEASRKDSDQIPEIHQPPMVPAGSL